MINLTSRVCIMYFKHCRKYPLNIHFHFHITLVEYAHNHDDIHFQFQIMNCTLSNCNHENIVSVCRSACLHLRSVQVLVLILLLSLWSSVGGPILIGMIHQGAVPLFPCGVTRWLTCYRNFSKFI